MEICTFMCPEEDEHSREEHQGMTTFGDEAALTRTTKSYWSPI